MPGFSDAKQTSAAFDKIAGNGLNLLQHKRVTLNSPKKGRRGFEWIDINMSNNGLVYLRPTRLVYVRACGRYRNTIPASWDKMLNWLDRNGLRSPVGHGYGLARDNPNIVAPEACRYDACVELDPLFEERAARELAIQTLPGGSHIRLRKKGDYADMTRTVISLHSTFEAPNGLRMDDRRPIVSIYLDDPRRIDVNDLRADLCVPVSARVARARDDQEEAA